MSGFRDFGGGRGSSGGRSDFMKVEASSVGKIIGSRGSKIQDLEARSKTKITISKEEDEDGMKSVEIRGSDEGIDQARELIEECLNSDSYGGGRSGGYGGRSGGYGGGRDRGYGRRDDYGGGGGWGGRRDDDGGWGRRDDYQRGGGRRNYGEDGDSKETVLVDSKDIGKIIGKGGSVVKSLQSQSGCRITVARDRDVDSKGRSPVVLFGSQDGILEAKRLIQESGVDIFNEANGRGGRDNYESVNGTGEYSFSTANGVAPNGHAVEEVKVDKPKPQIDWNRFRHSDESYRNQKFEGLPPIVKDFYKENAEVSNMSFHTAQEIRKNNNNIIVEGPGGGPEGVPNPITSFEQAFEAYPQIMDEINKQDFVKPSPIQSQAWPVLLKGRDLIGIAQTGTGKTLAFLLPALIHIDQQPVPRSERNGPSALILSPTRELAQQIEIEINKINYKGIRSICVYGGGDRREQKRRVQEGVEIVVATPGRLNDFLMNDIISVSSVTYLVMDEADRMLDLGFEVEIKKVMLDIRPDRQTVMTSATWPPEVQALADKYTANPTKVFVGTLDLAAVHSVKQHVEIVDETEKRSLLLDFIEQMGPTDKVIVFVGKKAMADHLSSDLAMSGIECQSLHGDREQYDRERALEDFKDSSVRILVATDVASRGLDVKDITHVINYDFPRHVEEYVHRIGRTGRAGRSGTSITFVTRNDWKSAQTLIDIMSEANQEIPDELVSMAQRYTSFKEKRQRGDGQASGRRGRGGRGGRGRNGGRGRHDDFMDSDEFIMMM